MPKSTATNPAGGRAALVIAPQWVGDAILSLPLIHQLASEYSTVDVMAVPAVSAVYRCSADVHRLHVVDFAHGELQWHLRREVARQYRGRYQTAIVLPNSLKSALVPWLARIPVRRGMLGESRYVLINDRRALDHAPAQPARSRPSMLDQYLALADQPIDHANIARLDAHRPVMMIPDDATSFGNHGLEPKALSGFLQHSLLAICPGAEYGPAKQWPADYFAQVANDWINTGAHRAVVIIGGPKDVPLGETIHAKILGSSRVLDLCGKTKLLEAFCWLSQAKVAVSNDSGLMHAAAALGIPVVGIFGSSDPHHTPPHARAARALSLELDCSPCFQRVCPLGTTACLKQLHPTQVLNAINDLIGSVPAAHDATSPAS